ncbi:MAG: hypothetical protein FWG89_04050 [Treponema sp.]|nr:hypothetical protein [Treponema sp.]
MILERTCLDKQDDRYQCSTFEIDILLENGEKAMLVEVKTKLTKERIIKQVLSTVPGRILLYHIMTRKRYGGYHKKTTAVRYPS